MRFSKLTTALGPFLGIAMTLSISSPAAAGATAVSSVNAPASVTRGSNAIVSGSITFGEDVTTIATDAAGDIPAPQAAAGMDLVGASVTSDPAKPNELIWKIKTASLPPGVDAVPEAVFYWWNFTANDEPFGYDVRRTNVYRQTNTNPFFRVRKCPDGTCTDAFTPTNGAIDQANSEIRSTFRLSQLPGLAGGSSIIMGSLESSHGTGARWLYGLGDGMAPEIEEYVIPFADVKVGIADPGAMPFSTVNATVSGSTATRSFSAAVPTTGKPAGTYDLVVSACWGSNCAEARRSIQLA